MKSFLARWQRKLPRCLGAAGLSLLVATGCSTVTERSPHDEPLAQYDEKTLTVEARSELAFAKGRAFEQSGELDKAMAAYKEVLNLDPESAEANRRLAIVYDKQGAFDRSPPYYQKALELNPGNPDTYCDAGYSLYLQKRYPEAEMNLRQSLALRFDHPRAHNNLAMVLAHTGRIKESMAEFNNAGVPAAKAYTNIAFAMTVQQNFPEAQKYYKLALAADPNSRDAQQGKYELDQLVAKYHRLKRVMAEAETPAVENPMDQQIADSQPRQPVAPRTPVPPQRQVVAQQPAAQPQQQVAAQQPAAQPQQQMPVQQVQRVEPLPQVQRQVADNQPAAAGRSALKLSFSPGALRRDRYLEEQTDPSLQQVTYEEEAESN